MIDSIRHTYGMTYEPLNTPKDKYIPPTLQQNVDKMLAALKESGRIGLTQLKELKVLSPAVTRRAVNELERQGLVNIETIIKGKKQKTYWVSVSTKILD